MRELVSLYERWREGARFRPVGSGSVSRFWIQEADHFGHRLGPAGDSGRHRRGDPVVPLGPERQVRAAPVVEEEVDRDGGGVVLDLLGEGIRQLGEPLHAHPHGEILALDVGG